MTLEASFLMPLLLGGIVLTIYLGFFLYNSCLIRQAAYTAALRGSLIKEGSKEQIEDTARQALEKLLENRLLAVEEWEAHITAGLTEVKVHIRAKGQIPFVQIISESIGIWTYEGKGEAKRLKPVDFIRTVRQRIQ